MSDDKGFSPQEFGASFQDFMKQMAAQRPSEEPVFARRLREHFGEAVAGLPIVEEAFQKADRPNVQVALDAYLGSEGRSHELLGVTGSEARFMGIRLSDLVSESSASAMFGRPAPVPGPIEYVHVPLSDGEVMACVRSGMFLIRDAEEPLAVLVGGEREMGWGGKKLKLEAMGRTREAAERFLGEVRKLARRDNVYRGHVVSLSVDQDRTLKVDFHRLPGVERDGIVLPEGTLERIERNAIRFSEHRSRLLAAGRHLKRGILLYGPPGTGKTLTAMHLAGRMNDRTVILITGRTQGLLTQSCAMARLLEPATVILEDVDLIATDRARQQTDCNALLFELLNEMDGLSEDVDILFILTTNRPEVLEPALAARPGRVDLAVEIPLPDYQCRKRLFELYAHGLTMNIDDIGRYIERTDGGSGAFIRELLRKAALFAADDSPDADTIAVESRHLDEALRELVLEAGAMTQSLLGLRRPAAG